MTRSLLAAASVLVLLGGRAVADCRADKVHVGMTEDEVKDVCGCDKWDTRSEESVNGGESSVTLQYSSHDSLFVHTPAEADAARAKGIRSVTVLLREGKVTKVTAVVIHFNPDQETGR